MNQCARRNPALWGGLGAALIFDIMFKNFQSDAAGGGDKESTAPDGPGVLTVEEAAKPVQHGAGCLAFQFSDYLGQHNGGWGVQDKVDVIFLPVGLDNLAVDKSCCLAQTGEQKISPLCGEYMTTKLHAPNDVVGQAVNAVACCVKVRVADELAHRLDELYPIALRDARLMLHDRSKSSSKHWPDLPCVVSKSLIAKYQRNQKCHRIHRLVIAICGDKGKQVKLEGAGIRVPALFKKAVLPVAFRRPVGGFVRQAEFFKRGPQWFCSVCYNTPCAPSVQATGCIGVDRNSVGNVAVMADPVTGKARHLGFNPARTKQCWRNRKKNLQRQGNRRLLSKLKRNHARRTTHQNHIVSKQIVDNAATHCRAIAVEKLEGVTAKGSKIRSYSNRNQWAFAQLLQFINYKAALRGVSVVEVDPAYTSQECSRCGERHKVSGKQFQCPSCGHQDHRDANAAFVIAKRGLECIGGLAGDSARPRCGPLDGPRSGTLAATKILCN